MNCIASERRRSGMSQDELCKLIKKNRATLSRWENGDGGPGSDDLLALSGIFGCSVDYLLGLSEERKPR